MKWFKKTIYFWKHIKTTKNNSSSDDDDDNDDVASINTTYSEIEDDEQVYIPLQL